MCKEENIINGILHYRTSPNAELKPYTLEDFTNIVEILNQQQGKTLEEKLDKIVSKEPSKFWEESDERLKDKETLEEAARNYSIYNEQINKAIQEAVIFGAKLQEEKTIEEVFEWLTTKNYLTDLKETLIKEFKNK